MRSALLLTLVGLMTGAIQSKAQADESGYALLDSTYMDKGSVALLYRSQNTPADTAGMAGVEWSWTAHPKLSLGLDLATATDTVEIKNPSGTGAPVREASLFQVGVRCESNLLKWRFLTLTPDFELGSLNVGYRGRFENAADDKWRSTSVPYLMLGATLYVRISPETELGAVTDLQRTNEVHLTGFNAAKLSGTSFGVKLKRWF